MRKLACCTLIVGSIAVIGCGGGGEDDAASPLDNALSYLPADTPFAVAIDTDTSGSQFRAIGRIADQFPFIGERIEQQLKEELEQQAGDFEQIQKALGNDFVVGSTDAKSFVALSSGKDRKFVGAIQAKDEQAIDDLLEQAGAEEDGEASGARIYNSSSDDVFAVKDDVLIVAGTRGELERALETRESDDHFTEEEFDTGTRGLARDALIRAYLDVGQLLRASGDAQDALEVKWVRAVRELGLALSFQSRQVAIDFRVATDPEGLTEADVPIATGAAAPRVIDQADQIGFALRDPAHVLDFAQAIAKAVDPRGFSNFEGARGTLESRLDLSLEEDLLAQLKGDLAVIVDLNGKFGARAELEDPAAFEQTLDKLARVLPDLAEGAVGREVGFARPKPGEDYYALATADGENIVFGVVDGMFVISNDPEKAGALVAAEAVAVPGAEGALVLSTDAEQVARGGLRQARDQIEEQLGALGARLGGELATAPLDRLTGSVESSTSGLTGSFELTLDD